MKKAILWMTENHVTVNLVMLFIIFAGAVTAFSLKEEIFPELELDMITISVVYPGAAPDEVEKGVVIKIEEAIATIQGIEKVNGNASENAGTVVATLILGEDMTKIKNEIEGAIDRITTFPDSIERPTITESTVTSQVIQIALYGDLTEETLTTLSESMRDELIDFPELSQVGISGIRNDEISVEVSEEKLQRYNISIATISKAIQQGSLDLPGGKVKTDSGDILIRTKAQGMNRVDYENIVIRSNQNGHTLRIKDVATVRDQFEESDLKTSFDGKPGVILTAYRTGEERVTDIAARVKKYVKLKKLELPEGVSVSLWNDQSNLLQQRKDLLYRNALFGLLLVLISLTIFLDIRLAIWVTLGIVISFFGSFIVMELLDVSINMISLFGFILVLGIVVDDAIVVGENIFSQREMGETPQNASKKGAVKVAVPVVFAVLTTVAAFGPLLFIDGTMGKVMKVIPIIVVSVLLFSLFESLFILPAHLSTIKKKPMFLLKPFALITFIADKALDLFIRKVFKPILVFAIKWRYVTITTSIIMLILTIALYRGGVVKFTFFPEIEADNMVAIVTMPKGSSIAETEKVVKRLEDAAFRVKKELNQRYPEDNGKTVKHIFSMIGETPSSRRGPRAKKSSTYDPSVAEINIDLLSSEERHFSSLKAMNLWREYAGEIPGAKSITFSSSMMSAGDAIDIKLSAPDNDDLNNAVADLKTYLGTFKGVFDVQDDFEEGKYEIKLKLKPNAERYGITLYNLALQTRNGFYGAESFRIQRGKDEVKVMVRYQEKERRSLSDIENMMIRTVKGNEIPFSYVAQVDYGRGFSTIRRLNKKRIIKISGNIDDDIANANDIHKELVKKINTELKQKYKGLSYTFGGRQEQQQKTMGSLTKGFIIALFLIYSLLAIPFKSYAQPLIIMFAIPFGIIGAVMGHYLLGFNLSMMSAFGIVALAGVVVNDSLVLVDFVNIQHREEEHPLFEAIVIAAQKRFRPIMLTSVTTFLGLTPMILETSLQAQFLIPMAVSLGFGILFATLITLIIIPAMLLILDDIQKGLKWLFTLNDQKNDQKEVQGEI